MRDMIDAQLQAEVLKMMAALKAIEPPTDHVGVERMAKALMAAKKASDMINAAPDTDTDNEQQELDAMHDDDLPPTSGPDALDAWAELLERKIARYGVAARAERVDTGTHAERVQEDCEGLGVLGQSGADRP